MQVEIGLDCIGDGEYWSGLDVKWFDRQMAAGDDPGTLVNAAVALAYFGEDIGAMLALNRGRPSCGAWLDKRAVVSASGF